MTDIEPGMLVEWVYGDYANPPGPRPMLGLVVKVYKHGRWIGGYHYDPTPVADVIWRGEEQTIRVGYKYLKPHASSESTPGAVPNNLNKNLYSKHNQ